MGAQGRRRAERAPQSRAPLALVVVAAAAILVTLAASSVRPWAGEQGSTKVRNRPEITTPTPSHGSVDLSNLPVPRSLDCRVIDDEAVRVAIGGPVDRRTSYQSGERAEIAPGVTDVAHEDSCSFANGAAEARIWVFAAPVGPAEARPLIREARATAGCRFLDTATGFGTPDLTGVCGHRERKAGRPVVATLRGLFGDAWLSCELTDNGDTYRDDVLSRASQWCVHAATTLGARP